MNLMLLVHRDLAPRDVLTLFGSTIRTHRTSTCCHVRSIKTIPIISKIGEGYIAGMACTWRFKMGSISLPCRGTFGGIRLEDFGLSNFSPARPPATFIDAVDGFPGQTLAFGPGAENTLSLPLVARNR